MLLFAGIHAGFGMAGASRCAPSRHQLASRGTRRRLLRKSVEES